MKSPLRFTLQLGMGMAMAASSAMGAFTVGQGDLVLGFQATSGTGQFTNVFFNLGSGVYHRDNPAGNNPFGTTGQTQIGNIGTTLALAFGDNWFDRSDVFFGVYGNYSFTSNTGIGATAPFEGDPSRTSYVSQATDTIGGSLPWTGINSAALGLAGGAFNGLKGTASTLTPELDGAAILTQSADPVGWNNSWSAWNPTPGGAFGIYGGGIQQNFGEIDDVTYIDLQRIVSTSTGANPTGTVGTGSIETTFAIGRDGSITAVPEPSSFALAMIAGLSFCMRRRRSA